MQREPPLTVQLTTRSAGMDLQAIMARCPSHRMPACPAFLLCHSAAPLGLHICSDASGRGSAGLRQ